MAALPAHWVNGCFAKGIDPADRGLAYGDGLFETMRFYNRRILQLRYHLERLQLGCECLGIECNPTAIERHLQEATSHLVKHAISHACVKLTLTRGANLERGHPPGYGARHGESTLVIRVTQVEAPGLSAPASMGVCSIRLSEQPVLAGLKHCNRLEQVVAAREVSNAGWDNGLLLNQRDEVVSAVSANLFLYRDFQLITPALTACGVEGTMKKLVVEQLAPALNIPVVSAMVCMSEVAAADELLLTNAMIGVQAACIHGQAPTAIGPVTGRLWREYQRGLRGAN